MLFAYYDAKEREHIGMNEFQIQLSLWRSITKENDLYLMSKIVLKSVYHNKLVIIIDALTLSTFVRIGGLRGQTSWR